MTICRKCGNAFYKPPGSRCTLCDKCWLAYKKGPSAYVIDGKSKTHIKICKDCKKEEFIFAKDLCLKCYGKRRRLMKKGEK